MRRQPHKLAFLIPVMDPAQSGKAAWHHLYKSALWLRMRGAQLARQPLCCMCGNLGLVTPATTVDHIRPHKGDKALFFDAGNLQSLCKACHDSTKQTQEQRGYLPGCDALGRPIDPDHPWNR